MVQPPVVPARLLLPADVMKPKPQGPTLQLPEKPPPALKRPVGEEPGFSP